VDVPLTCEKWRSTRVLRCVAVARAFTVTTRTPPELVNQFLASHRISFMFALQWRRTGGSDPVPLKELRCIRPLLVPTSRPPVGQCKSSLITARSAPARKSERVLVFSLSPTMRCSSDGGSYVSKHFLLLPRHSQVG